MPKATTKRAARKNPPRRPAAGSDHEDARDMAFIQRNRSKFRFLSWNKLMRELGYDDLQTPDRR